MFHQTLIDQMIATRAALMAMAGTLADTPWPLLEKTPRNRIIRSFSQGDYPALCPSRALSVFGRAPFGQCPVGILSVV
jgi:hypothetical protein